MWASKSTMEYRVLSVYEDSDYRGYLVYETSCGRRSCEQPRFTVGSGRGTSPFLNGRCLLRTFIILRPLFRDFHVKSGRPLNNKNTPLTRND